MYQNVSLVFQQALVSLTPNFYFSKGPSAFISCSWDAIQASVFPPRLCIVVSQCLLCRVNSSGESSYGQLPNIPTPSHDPATPFPPLLQSAGTTGKINRLCCRLGTYSNILSIIHSINISILLTGQSAMIKAKFAVLRFPWHCAVVFFFFYLYRITENFFFFFLEVHVRSYFQA